MTRGKRVPRCISLFVLLPAFFFLTAQVSAQGNIHLGRLEVRGSVAYKAEYLDNIYSAPTERIDDFIHTITPEITFSYQGAPGNFLDFGFGADLVSYSDYSDNNYQTYRTFVSGGYKSPYGLYLLANDNFMFTADPYGHVNQFRLGVPQTKRWDNTVSGTVGYEFADRYAVEGKYSYYLLRYEKDADVWQDRTDNVFGGTLLYGVTPKTAFLVEYRRTYAEYDKQNDGAIDLGRSTIAGAPVFWSGATSQDYTLDDFYIGARFKPGAKLSGQIKIGYGKKTYDNPLDASGNLYRDQSTWLGETSVGYQIRERTSLNLTLYRSILGSPDATSSSYFDTRVGLNAQHGFRDNLLLSLGYFWGNNDYQDMAAGLPEKEFNTNEFDARVEYIIKDWLSATAQYKYNDKNATDDLYDSENYTRNSISAGVKAMF